jgi:hypothetical protein
VADTIILATARDQQARLHTMDSDFRGIVDVGVGGFHPLNPEARQALQATGYPRAKGLTTGSAIMAA